MFESCAFADRVLEATYTAGLGSFVVAGSRPSFQTFLEALGADAETVYMTEHETLDEWEIGIGTVQADGRVTRDTVIAGTNGTSKVNFSSGLKYVRCVVPAALIEQLIGSGVVGPELSTDRAIPTWNGTNGRTLRNSGVRITSSDKILGVASAFPSVAVADAATITFNCNAGNFFETTLEGNRTLAVSGVTEGQNIQVALKQDDDGSRTVTWWPNIYWPGGVVPVLTTTPGAVDVFGFRCIGVTPGYSVPIWRGSTHGLNYGG